MSDRQILCLDFDGVLHSYASGWRGARNIPDPPVDGAMEFLLLAMERFEVVIHSSRSRHFGGRRAMRRWLRASLSDYLWSCGGSASSCYTANDYEEHYELIADGIARRIKFPLWKPPAHITIDDRAITFTGSWPDLATIANFKPWNRRAA